MDKFTIEQKQVIIGTNHYISQFNSKVRDEAYGDTPSWKILDDWLSSILGVDFRQDIYNNKSVFELNKIDSVKNQFKEKYNQGWFIGDALKDAIYTLCYHNIQDVDAIYNKEKEIREMWEFFKSLAPTVEPKKEEIFAPSGITVNGEMLYKKVVV